MARIWRCYFCKTENDPTDQFRQVGANVCEGEGCGKSRFLLPLLAAAGLLVIFGAVGGVVFAITQPKRAYSTAFRTYYSDRQISPEEREQLDKSMRRFKITPEQRDEWEKAEIAALGGPAVADGPEPPVSNKPSVRNDGLPPEEQIATGPDATVFIKQGMIYASQKNFAAAAKEFDAATKADATSPEAWTDLGSARQQLRDYPGALEAYTRALAINPDYWQAHYNVGTLYVRLNDSEKALDELEKAIESVSRDSRTTRTELIRAMQKDGDLAVLRRDSRFKELIAKHQGRSG